MLLKYWNRLARMEDDRLVKRAFLVSATLAGTTRGRSRLKTWAGQAAAVPHPQVLLHPTALAVSDGSQVSRLQRGDTLFGIDGC